MHRKPDEKHRRAGTFRSDRHKKKGKKASGDVPRCPSWLPPMGKTAWKKLAPQLHENGLLDNVSSHQLAIYCSAFAQWRRAQDALEAEGYVQVAASGYMSQSPWVAISRAASKEMSAVGAEFGLTPGARSRQGVRIKDPKSGTGLSNVARWLSGDDDDDPVSEWE